MAHGQGEVLELFLTGGGRAGRIRCPAALRPRVGQYLLASRLADPTGPEMLLASLEPLPVPLFPALPNPLEPQPDCLTVAPPLPAAWSIGAPLALRGALGKGFHLPATAQRVILAVWQRSPARLLPLAHQALARGASVVLCLPQSGAGWLPVDLPAEIEVLPLDGLGELLRWADYAAADLSPDQLADLRGRLRLAQDQPAGIPFEVLLDVPMPCGGAAECGACAVKTRRGWKLACQDGPVFDLNLLGEP